MDAWQIWTASLPILDNKANKEPLSFPSICSDFIAKHKKLENNPQDEMIPTHLI